MSAPVDVNARLVWGRQKLHRIRLTVVVIGAAAGLVILLLADDLFELVTGWGSVVVFPLWALYEIYWLTRKDTALIELLPQGIIFRMPGLEHFIVPWHEVRGVDSIDIHTTFRGQPVLFENVTVVLVSRFFYDRVIHVDTFILRGPGWETNFIPKGDKVQLALHHEVLPVTAEEIRRQVEARWKAFGQPATAAEPPTRTPSVAGTIDPSG